ncbi:MAG: hypothetical protein KJI71_05190 [Patescibacteria group bacterium]|nr:hypothetical protein [Patescibacteria group bacterium]
MSKIRFNPTCVGVIVCIALIVSLYGFIPTCVGVILLFLTELDIPLKFLTIGFLSIV